MDNSGLDVLRDELEESRDAIRIGLAWEKAERLAFAKGLVLQLGAFPGDPERLYLATVLRPARVEDGEELAVPVYGQYALSPWEALGHVIKHLEDAP